MWVRFGVDVVRVLWCYVCVAVVSLCATKSIVLDSRVDGFFSVSLS